MGDQSLRDALEKLATWWTELDTRCDLPDNAQWGEGVGQGYRNAAADLLRTLAAHPAEPAPPSMLHAELLVADKLERHGWDDAAQAIRNRRLG